MRNILSKFKEKRKKREINPKRAFAVLGVLLLLSVAYSAYSFAFASADDSDPAYVSNAYIKTSTLSNGSGAEIAIDKDGVSRITGLDAYINTAKLKEDYSSTVTVDRIDGFETVNLPVSRSQDGSSYITIPAGTFSNYTIDTTYKYVLLEVKYYPLLTNSDAWFTNGTIDKNANGEYVVKRAVSQPGFSIPVGSVITDETTCYKYTYNGNSVPVYYTGRGVQTAEFPVKVCDYANTDWDSGGEFTAWDPETIVGIAFTVPMLDVDTAPLAIEILQDGDPERAMSTSDGALLLERIGVPSYGSLVYTVTTSSPFIIKGLVIMMAAMTGKDYSYGAISVDPAFSGDIIKKALTSVSEVLEDPGQYASALKGVMDAVSVAAVSLFLLFWLLYVIGSLIKERPSPESLFKAILTLIVGLAICLNTGTIANGIVRLGLAVNGVVAESTQLVVSDYDAFFKRQLMMAIMSSFRFVFGLRLRVIGIDIEAKAGVIWLGLGAFVPFAVILIPFIAYVSCMFSLIATLIKYVIKVIVRIYTAPITLAYAAVDAHGGGTSSLSMWIKKTLSLVLKPVVIVIVICAAPVISAILYKIFGPAAISGKYLLEIGPVVGLTMTYKIIKDLTTNLEFDIG